MNGLLLPLNLLPLGQKAKVKEIIAGGDVRRRILDLGLIADTQVEALLASPSGDPRAYGIRGAVIALRFELASKILVEAI